MSKQVLDPCCGSRMFYFDRQNDDVLYGDIRSENHTLCDGRLLEIKPDMVMDFRDMPFDDCAFKLIVFDPPHLKWAGQKSYMRAKYGQLDKNSWRDDLAKGFKECWRVLDVGGTLIFKWSEAQIKLAELRPLFPDNPLFGHTTTKNLKTHWIVFFKTKTPGGQVSGS